KYLYRTREEMMADAEEAIKKGKAAMPRAFGLQPQADVTVFPIPAYQEKFMAPHYFAAALDGSRAAQYRIRLYQPEQQSRVLSETTAFHETIPGHHLQVAIANERTGLPRLARFGWIPGYGEGWALY